MGGMIPAIEQGYVQTEIQKAAYRFNQELESGERVVVGVNKFTEKENAQGELLKIDEKVQKDQIEFLNKVRSGRDNLAVQNKLAELRKAAEGNENLMPYIIDAVKVYTSLGEICNTMRDVFGEYKETVVI